MDDSARDTHSAWCSATTALPAVATCLAALTLLTCLELADVLATDSNDTVAGAPPVANVHAEVNRVAVALKAARADVAGSRSEQTAELERVSSAVRETMLSVDSQVRSSFEGFRRQLEVHRRETNTRADDVGAAKGPERLYSGHLQYFAGLRWIEAIVASRLDIERTVSHHELRAWRQRLMGQLHELDKQLGDEPTRRNQIASWEEKLGVVLSLWGQHFRRAGSDVPTTTTSVLSLEEMGFEPIYQGVFAEDAVPHPSDPEGRKLHDLYNKNPRP